jgi:hypothetical protein
LLSRMLYGGCIKFTVFLLVTQSGTTLILLELVAILKVGVHLPKVGVFLTQSGSARTVYL